MDQPFIDLLDSLYAAPLRQGAWNVPLAAAANMLEAAGAVLLFQDRSPSAPRNDGEVLAMIGFPAHAAALYFDEFASDDYRISRVVAAEAGTVFADECNMDYELYRRSRIFNEFYRPLGIDRTISMRLFDGDRTAVVSAFAAPDREPWRPAELRLFRRLAPHLTRSLQLKRQVDRADAVAAGLRLGLDHFAMAVMLLDGAQRLVVANRAAEALLARSGSPLRLRAGRLVAAAGAEGELGRHLAAAAAPMRHAPAPVLRLASQDGGAVFGVMAVPLQGGREGGDGMLVFVSDPASAAAVDSGLLGAQLGLSGAEAEVVAALCRGVSAEGVARERGVSVSTVRSQIKSVLAKTGSGSQAALVALAARSLAGLRRS